MMKRFHSELINISSLKAQRFLIPSYQRPYVWAEEQIEKLLHDLWDAFDRGDEKYYLGTVVTSPNGQDEELIDGQQRFTTLWLIALTFHRFGNPSGLDQLLLTRGELRLHFAIRGEVENYLRLLYQRPFDQEAYRLPDALLEEFPYLKGIARAAEIIKNAIPHLPERSNKRATPDLMSAFAGFIAVRVLFVKNTAPGQADLKKLFATLNNSGIQLEQADILKSRLLEQLKSQKIVYSRLWEACEHMNGYFEQNVRNSFPEVLLTPDKLAAFDPRFFYPGTSVQETALQQKSLAQILQEPMPGNHETLLRQPDGRSVTCESIVTFPQLLLHALRIHLKLGDCADFDQPFHSGNLLKIFEILNKAGEEEIKRFLGHLWQLRYLFDRYVIKWIEKDGERILGLRSLNSELQRDPVAAQSRSGMLQSLLYFTSNYNTQMWLSAYLHDLLDGLTDLENLEAIDNALSLSQLTDKQATWDWIHHRRLNRDWDYQTYLRERNGTGFRHYWFFKLEYILWKNWTADREDKRFRTYRITSKNSIEHIFPQHEEFGSVLLDKEEKPLGDSFGNLTLLSVGENSSYGNQAAGKKRIDLQGKPTYPSLKLVKFFEVCGEQPDYENVIRHLEEMISALNGHYKEAAPETSLLVALLNT